MDGTFSLFGRVAVLVGDNRETLARLPAESVHCCVTSPPYWNLRDYDTVELDWPAMAYAPMPGMDARLELPAWRGSFGLEPTLEMYCGHLVVMLRAVARVLRKDGTCWLNLGDTYGSRPNGPNGVIGATTLEGSTKPHAAYRRAHGRRKKTAGRGSGHKQLSLMPHRVALALQADGWVVRDDVVWAKLAPMPESVTDRCTRAHEYVFQLARCTRYFYDHVAVAEATVYKATDSTDAARVFSRRRAQNPTPRQEPAERPEEGNRELRNRRNVWLLPPAPYPKAHFATFPPRLAELCLLAGSSAGGCCAVCGAFRRRVQGERPVRRTGGTGSRAAEVMPQQGSTGALVTATWRGMSETATWVPGCGCDAPTVPCTVLDPFGGSGTTGQAALAQDRNAVLCELQPSYVPLIHERAAARDMDVSQLPCPGRLAGRAEPQTA